MAETTPLYKDASLAITDRVSDLISRMTLEEKAGLMFHNMIRPGTDGELSGPVPEMDILDTRELVKVKQMSHFNVIGPITNPKLVASWHNTLQQYALDNTRLGIPITLSTDPRNHFNSNVGTSFRAGVMSQWPETLGFGALRDPDLVRAFADIVRREYLAVGLRVALHPQADLATEYRWARVNSTFAEDGELAAELVAAYVEGFQGPGLLRASTDGRESVSTMTKHFPGAGPEMGGEDSHFVYGREQVYPGDNIEYHLEPFRKAIEAGTRQIMPSYAMPVGTKYEEVGFAFNKGVITDILRKELGFTGIVCTDWGLITDTVLQGQDMPARAWGCEHLSELERVIKILNAGCDQFGGESRPELVVQAVKEGFITEARINESICRILTEKFALGLFDDKRFVDAGRAAEIVGHEHFMRLGHNTQCRSFTILTNFNDTLPLSPQHSSGSRFYVEGVPADAVAKRGLSVAESYREADIALIRLQAPYEPRPGGFERKFHSGSLEFPEKEIARLSKIIDTVPITILDVYLDRPAVLTPLVEEQERVSERTGLTAHKESRGTALMVNYGANADAFLDVCFGGGDALPEGRLPFDLPRSMDAASHSREDMPFDTANPLFRFGFGLRYVPH
ncbi:periplasmic beta-glucosidase precursor [Xylariales sp. PMI_506]|nr:periplasmic beta-glucosidase precursor [Xylariales sp. PMI_506]